MAGEPFTLLLSSAGRRVELMQCFRTAAKELGLALRVVAADARPDLSAACQLAEKSVPVPRCHEPGFVPALLDICEKEAVRLVVPTIDPELEALARNRSAFEQRGSIPAVSCPEVVAIARNKLRTCEFLQSIGIRCPRTAQLEEALASPASWSGPVVAKPANGSSSRDVHVFSQIQDAASLLPGVHGFVVQDLIPGSEFTVNLFFDARGLRCAVPHWRMETRGGEVSKGLTRRIPALMEAAEKIGRALDGKAFGPLCFQAMVTDSGEAFVFELNARFGGGYPLADRAGAKFARWLLELALHRHCSANNNWRENVMMLRYDAAVFSEGAQPIDHLNA